MITFSLPFPVSVNNHTRNVPGRGRVKTAEYKAWIAEAGWELKRQRPPKIKGKVRIAYLMEDTGNCDLGNLEKGATDLLVSHQVIEGDRRSIVRGIHLDWSPEVRGCQVTITPEGK